MSGWGSRAGCRCGIKVLLVAGGVMAASAAIAVGIESGGPASASEAARGWQFAEDDHTAHHPGAASGAGAATQPGNPAQNPSAAPPSGGSGMGMMGEMMGRPRKEFYPSLMELPALSPQQRRDLEARARALISDEIDGIPAAGNELRHAIAAGEIAAAERASVRIRESLNAVQGGVAVLRALGEGKSAQQIAQGWFKTQMNLSAPADGTGSAGLLGISWFHVTTMALLAIFAAGLLAIHVARMRRANALVDRLTRSVIPGAALPAATALSGVAGGIAERASRPAAAIEPVAREAASPPPESRRALAASGKLWKGKLKVAAIYAETPGVKTFRLQAVDGNAIPFSFLPGQFLTYAADIDGKTVRRSYTIASSAAQTAYVETTIKREDGGLFSDHMHGRVKEGDLLEVMAPSGAFTFTGEESDSVVLIGGGVGITPLMAAIRYLSDIAWPGQIYLVYGAQTTEQFIFREELEYLQRRIGNLHVAATMARASGASWMGSEGQITADFLKRAVPDLARRRIHLCGPPGMMEALRKTLGELGVPPGQIKTEAFGPARGAVPPPGRTVIETRTPEPAAAIGPATASIRFTKSDKLAPLPPDQSVLEAAESIGVAIDFSCRAGICGVCKTQLLDGKVTMEVEDALSAEEKARGIILACQAKSVGNLVVEA